MKKNLLTLLVLLVTSTVVFSQTPNTQDAKNKIGLDGKREGYWEITALMKKLGSPWTPAQIVEKGNYVGSMKTGMWTEFFQNGKVKSELTFVNNRPNGPAKTYFDNGQLEAEGNWVGTRWTGPYTLYYDNGNVRQKFNYNSLGVRDGPQTYYHPNGKVAIEINMKNGKEEGVGKEYNTNGELIKETYSTNGVMDNSKTVTHEPKKAEVIVLPPEEIRKTDSSRVIVPGEGVNTGPFIGEGYNILYKDNHITMKGTFHKYRLVDGEERIYNTAGFCIRVKLYAKGKYIGDGVVQQEEKKN